MLRYYCESHTEAFNHASPTVNMIVDEIERNSMKVNKIIDLGSGNGRNSLFLAKKYGCEIVLIDHDKSMLDWAKKLCEQYDIKADYIQTRLEDIAANSRMYQKNNERYDIVILSYVLQHVDPVYYPLILDFCRDLCGGYFLVDVFWNPSRCRPGELISVGTINWYGLTYDELISLVAPRFRIVRDRIVCADSNVVINILSKEGATPFGCITNHDYNYAADYKTPLTRVRRAGRQRRNKIQEIYEKPFIESLCELYPSEMDIVLKEIREWSIGRTDISNSMMAAKMLWLCRSNMIPIYIEEILEGFSIKLKHLSKILIDGEYIPPLRISDYIGRVKSRLVLSEEIATRAQNIAKDKIIDGSSPRVIAGYSIIEAASRFETNIQPKKVAQALGISTVALRMYQSRISSR